ncbi:MAG: ABC transporter permease [Castellaniella sp.]
MPFKRHSGFRGNALLLAPAMLLLIVFFLLPNLDVIRVSFFDPDFTLQHVSKATSAPAYVRVFINTVQISLVVALLGTFIGYPVAYYINSRPKSIQIKLLLLILVPLWMSVLIRSYAWMVLLGRDGIVNSLLMGVALVDSPLRLLYTSGAVYVAMVQILLPVQIIASYSAMTEIDMGLVKAARICGASRFQALRRIFLPLSLDGTITGTALVFMLSMGFFITPALVGGRRDLMLGNLIMQHVQQLNWGLAAAIAVVMLAATLLIVTVIKGLGRALAHWMS